MGPVIQRLMDLSLRSAIRLEIIRSNIRRRSVVHVARKERSGFEQRLEQRYRPAFDRFDAFIVAGREAGIAHHAVRRVEAEKDNDAVYFALVRIHARSCLVTSEIRALLFAGHASGAMARWRTLHELAVTSLFVKEHGREVAERYFHHSGIVAVKAAEEYAAHTERLGMTPLEQEELSQLRESRDRLVALYGQSFMSDYGWAADALGRKRPTFADIEKSVDFNHWRPYYQLANHSVHAGFRGIEFDLGYGGHEPEVMLAGPSNAGLVEPAQCALLDFNMCTVSFLAYKPTPRSAINIRKLISMLQSCQNHFVEIDRQLKDEGDVERKQRMMP